MKKINLKSLNGFMDNALSREQLKFVVGGSGSYGSGGSGGSRPCSGKGEGAPCYWNGRYGSCKYFPFSYGLICWVG